MAAKKRPIGVTYLRHVKETKNMHRYEETDVNGNELERGEGYVHNIYVYKTAFKDKAPTNIKLTIEEDV